MNEQRCNALYEDLLYTISWAEMEKLLLEKARYECATTKQYDEIVEMENDNR